MNWKIFLKKFIIYCAVCSHVWLFVIPWTVAHQAPPSMEILQAKILEWVAMPSSRGSSQCRDGTQVSHIADGFFTIWATKVKVAQSYVTLCDPMEYTVLGILQARILKWVAFPFPEDLPDPGIESRSPAPQADSLPTKPSGKPIDWLGLLQTLCLPKCTAKLHFPGSLAIQCRLLMRA